ncbi:MAG TPA: ABC transporter substrate-binding protein [Spirochaetia bacterium]|nr:ABC transporter substrate-binding protein [Spirochaetia bacterium]
MNKAVRAVAFLCLGGLLTAGAGRLWAQATTSPAVDADEKAMAAEKRPDFSSPPVVDSALVVPGLPEKLVWYTSRPGIFGSARARQGGTFHGYIAEYPDTFRTVGPNSNDAYRPFFLTSPNIVDTNAETKEWMPALATDWAFSADGKSVYFKLNEKARWTDGQPITSADYTFMYDMMRSPNIQDPYANDYFTTQITDVKAFGDWVVRLTWQVPASHDDLLYDLLVQPRPKHFYPNGIPKDYVDAYQWVFEPTAGPYALASFTKGESLTFRKVKDWWGYAYAYNKYRFNVDTIQYQVITGGNDIIRNYFYNGQIDTYGLIIPQEWADSQGRDPVKKGYIDRQYMSYIPLQGVYGIVLNVKDPLFADVNVRRGLYYAIAIQKMIDTTLHGEYSRYQNIGMAHVFGGQSFDDTAIRKPDFDPV